MLMFCMLKCNRACIWFLIYLPHAHKYAQIKISKALSPLLADALNFLRPLPWMLFSYLTGSPEGLFAMNTGFMYAGSDYSNYCKQTVK